MHEDIIWQREIKNSNELDNFDQQEYIEYPSIHFFSEKENSFSNKNNNNSASENSVSYFKLSDLCCNINIYLKKLIGQDKNLDVTNDVSNRNNNNNFVNQPKCECWTVEDYFDQKFTHNSGLMNNKKLIKLDEKEKNDLLDLKNFDFNENNYIKIDGNKTNSFTSTSSHYSLNKVASKLEITYLKRRPSKFSLTLNKQETNDNFFEDFGSDLDIEKSLPDDDFFIEAINELGVKLSEVSTCFDSFDSQFKNFQNF